MGSGLKKAFVFQESPAVHERSGIRGFAPEEIKAADSYESETSS